MISISCSLSDLRGEASTHSRPGVNQAYTSTRG